MTDKTEIKEDKQLEKVFLQLSANEIEMEKVEKEVENYRIKKTQVLYEDRHKILRQIPNFWYVVLAQHEDFSDYLQTEDLRYIEYISDIYVEWKINDKEGDNSRRFSITFEFNSLEKAKFKDQVIVKDFQEINDPETGKPQLISTPITVEWPSSYDKVNPVKIRQKGGITKEDKKNYRQGMKSFFAWFSWTGMKPGKEFKLGEEFTRLIVDDVFPDAVKYYTEAMSSNMEDDEEGEFSSSDALDLSSDEEEGEESSKRPLEEEEEQSKKVKK